MRAAAAIALVLLLAGCGSPGHPLGPGTTGLTSTSDGAQHFDGAEALQMVRWVALEANGTARYRIPGTAGQAEGARALWEAARYQVGASCGPSPCDHTYDWSVAWQNLTGQDYLGLDRSMVRGYTPGPGVDRSACSQADEDRLPSLPFSNLYAVRHSAKAGAPLVLIGAHWDSQMHSDHDVPANRSLPDPGANDGASGVGVLLQLMRELPQHDLGVSVGLLFLDGEDGFYDCYPLAGSLWYAAHPLEKPSAFLLLDMVGDPGAAYAKESYSRQSAPRLVDLVWRHGQALDGARHFVNRTVAIEDDHLAFIHAGVPSADLIDAGRLDTEEGFPPQWDTAGDTVDKLDAAMLGLVGDVLLRTLQDPALPAALAPDGST